MDQFLEIDAFVELRKLIFPKALPTYVCLALVPLGIEQEPLDLYGLGSLMRFIGVIAANLLNVFSGFRAPSWGGGRFFLKISIERLVTSLLAAKAPN